MYVWLYVVGEIKLASRGATFSGYFLNCTLNRLLLLDGGVSLICGNGLMLLTGASIYILQDIGEVVQLLLFIGQKTSIEKANETHIETDY